MHTHTHIHTHTHTCFIRRGSQGLREKQQERNSLAKMCSLPGSICREAARKKRCAHLCVYSVCVCVHACVCVCECSNAGDAQSSGRGGGVVTVLDGRRGLPTRGFLRQTKRNKKFQKVGSRVLVGGGRR